MSDLMEAGVSSFFSTMDRDTYECGQDQRTGSTLSCPICVIVCTLYLRGTMCGKVSVFLLGFGRRMVAQA